MSMTPRARSSVLAPSFTRIASGRSLTIVRNAPSALWKSIGDVFFIRRDDILPTFSSFFALIAPVHSEGGVGHLPSMPASSDDGNIAVHFLGLDVDLDELLRPRLAPGLAFAVRQEPVEAGADQHDDVG